MADVNIGARLTLDTGGATESVKSFKQQLKEAQADVVNLSAKFGETSVQAQNAARKAAELADKIGDAKKLTDAFNPDQKFKALSGSLTGVLGGFTALQGAMGLLGVESKEVQKQLLKVQSAMALSQGLNQVGEAIASFRTMASVIVTKVVTAFSTLKGAIAATGIGALVVAIGTAIAYFGRLANKAKEAEEAQRRALELREQTAQAGLSASEAFIMRQSELEVARARAAGKSEKEIFDIQQAWQVERIASLKRYLADVQGDKVKALEASERIIALEQKMEIDRLNFQTSLREKSTGVKGEKKEKEKEKGIDLFPTDPEKRLEQQQELGRQFIANKKMLVNLGKDIDKEERESRMKELKDEVEMVRAAADEKIAIAEAEANVRKQFAVDIGNSLGALANLIGEQTAAGKALAIAQATINTWLGVTEILRTKSVLPEPIATISRIANVAAVIASGLTAVKNIIKTQVPGGGGGGGGASVSPPGVQPALATQTLLDQGQLNQIGNAASRAFVVESDVTNNQERIRRLNRAARL